MSFLDFIMAAFAVLFFAFARPLGKGGEGFGRDTTAALRGLAMLGIMLHHIHNALGYSSTILILAGYLTTGLFFFISGYGNTLSVNKRSKVSLDWLYKKILKIYIPFFAAYWIYYLFLILMHPELCPGIKETMVDLVTVSLPNEISWFPKIILLCFAVHWIAKKLFRNDTLQNGFITAVILVYMAIMWKTGQGDYWYNSVLCYPLGCFFARAGVFSKLLSALKSRKYLSFILCIILFVISAFLSMKISVLKLFLPVMFSLGCYYFSHVFKVKAGFFAWIGNNSFEFYMIHVACLQGAADLISICKYAYALAVVAVSFGIVFAYLFVKKKIKGL